MTGFIVMTGGSTVSSQVLHRGLELGEGLGHVHVEVALHLLDHLEVPLGDRDGVLDLGHRSLDLRSEDVGGDLSVVELLLDELLGLHDGRVVRLEVALELLEHLLRFVLIDHGGHGVLGDVALQRLANVLTHLIEGWTRIQFTTSELRVVHQVIGCHGHGSETVVDVAKLLVCPESHVVSRGPGAWHIASDIGPWRPRVHKRGRRVHVGFARRSLRC